jgi:hypothetical protein
LPLPQRRNNSFAAKNRKNTPERALGTQSIAIMGIDAAARSDICQIAASPPVKFGVTDRLRKLNPSIALTLPGAPEGPVDGGPFTVSNSSVRERFQVSAPVALD